MNIQDYIKKEKELIKWFTETINDYINDLQQAINTKELADILYYSKRIEDIINQQNTSKSVLKKLEGIFQDQIMNEKHKAWLKNRENKTNV